MQRTSIQTGLPPYPAPPPVSRAAAARPAPAPKRRSLTPVLILGGMLAFGALTTVCMAVVLAVLFLSQSRIPAGVSVGSVPVGGKAVEEVAPLLQQSLNSNGITMTDGDRKWLVTLAELGVSLNSEATLAAVKNAEADENITPMLDINLNTAQEALVALSELANIDPVAGDPPQMGRVMDIPTMLDRLLADVNSELADGIFELDMLDVEPVVEEAAAAAYDGATTTHIVETGQELALIAREYGITTQDIISLNNITNPDLIYIGQELIIPAAGVYTPPAPPAPSIVGKSILVSTGEQRIFAYENGSLVRSHLTSTGRTETPTVLGDYRIYVKHTATNMRGPGYFLPDVPYTMYFHAGYGIHGTYWHNSFGRPMSHGCVNLPIDEAQWFFNWAEVGTLVRVV